MPRRIWRQAAMVSLVLLLVVTLARTAWTAAHALRANAPPSVAAQWLRGTVIVVDPGHGGDDPGAVVGSTLEKDVVLQIGLQVKQLLEQQGARVIMTREQDKDLGGTMRQELGRRVALIDQQQANIYLSIHANKDTCRCWGAQTFYQRNGTPAGKELAVAIQNQLRQFTPTTRSSLAADYFVLRTSPVPATIVEVGFLTNAKEHEQLKDPGYQTTLAKAIVLGVADFFRSQAPKIKTGGTTSP